MKGDERPVVRRRRLLVADEEARERQEGQ